MTTQTTNRTLTIAGAFLLAVLLGGLLFVGTANAQGTEYPVGPGMHGMMGHGMMGHGMGATTPTTDTTPYVYPGMYGMMGYGMMGCPGHGMMGYVMGASTPVTSTTTYGYHHGGWGHGMMGSGR